MKQQRKRKSKGKKTCPPLPAPPFAYPRAPPPRRRSLPPRPASCGRGKPPANARARAVRPTKSTGLPCTPPRAPKGRPWPSRSLHLQVPFCLSHTLSLPLPGRPPRLREGGGCQVGEIEAKDGLPSADRNNKATLLLTGPFRTAKSSAKDLTPLVLKLQYAKYHDALRAPWKNRLLRR